jgi:transcriptional regulator with XRE-family HTH domain
MSRTLRTKRHQALGVYFREQRKRLNLTQAALASRLRRSQSFVSDFESGQRRIDVVELLDLAKALKFDPHEAIKRLARIKAD